MCRSVTALEVKPTLGRRLLDRWERQQVADSAPSTSRLLLIEKLQAFVYWSGLEFPSNTTTANVVPEPQTLVLQGLGLLGLAAARRRG